MGAYLTGDLVRYSKPIRFLPAPVDELVGIIVKVEGSKWCKVQWSDKLICTEHMHDLELLSRGA